ncbi:FAD-dependent oxidoreductase [Candidatus Daviesbacteria bacterium]|nr:FAD-dependent oxidoreductase [Candidatus Daviesbacteria bacterium]
MVPELTVYLVDELIWETPTVFRLKLTSENGRIFDFLPGQFAMLGLPYQGQVVKRAYSISNWPAAKDYLEFTIRVTGQFSQALSQKKPGDQVLVQGPYGLFIFDKNIVKKAVFLAGGVGIAPEKSMIEYIKDQKLQIPVWLFYANRSPDEVAYFEELSQMTKNYPWFKTILAVDNPDDNWQQAVGFVNQDLMEEHFNNWLDSTFFVCGPPAFVEATTQIIKQKGVDPKNIKTERFVGLDK